MGGPDRTRPEVACDGHRDIMHEILAPDFLGDMGEARDSNVKGRRAPHGSRVVKILSCFGRHARREVHYERLVPRFCRVSPPLLLFPSFTPPSPPTVRPLLRNTSKKS